MNKLLEKDLLLIQRCHYKKNIPRVKGEGKIERKNGCGDDKVADLMQEGMERMFVCSVWLDFRDFRDWIAGWSWNRLVNLTSNKLYYRYKLNITS